MSSEFKQQEGATDLLYPRPETCSTPGQRPALPQARDLLYPRPETCSTPGQRPALPQARDLLYPRPETCSTPGQRPALPQARDLLYPRPETGSIPGLHRCFSITGVFRSQVFFDHRCFLICNQDTMPYSSK